MTFSLLLPFPPTVNNYWHRSARGMYLSPLARSYKNKVAKAVGDFKTIKGAVHVNYRLIAPDHRRRDLDNYFKGLNDALTSAGVWLDDSQVLSLSASWVGVAKDGNIIVDIDEVCHE